LSPESKLLIALLSIFEECRLPVWFPLRDRIGFVVDRTQVARFNFWSRLSAATGRDFSRHVLTKNLQWGIAGPRAITHYINLFGLRDKVQPQEVFYPVHHQEVGWLSDATKSVESMTALNTRAIHLWSFMLGSIKESSAPPGSFLARLYREGK
jgi:hypothetical protein